MRAFRLLLALTLSLACNRSQAPAPPAPEAPLPPAPWRPAAVAHGGVGSPPEWSDGCRKAVDAAMAALAAGADPADAAVAGVVVMEDDPRFNAGTGALVRLDGRSVQMDASVMRSDGRFGAVAGIERVRNPVRVARAVMDTPHLLLQGDGATRFARTLGMPDYDPTTPASLARSERDRAKLLAGDPSIEPAWRSFDWRAHWNYETPLADAGLLPEAGAAPAAAHDTVGVAVRSADGRFGVALSTGGAGIALRGRVGDVPILGAGLFAGQHGAAACTGRGERIVEAGLAREVEAWLAQGLHAKDAADRAVASLKGRGDIGIIVASATELAVASDRPMASARSD